MAYLHTSLKIFLPIYALKLLLMKMRVLPVISYSNSFNIRD